MTLQLALATTKLMTSLQTHTSELEMIRKTFELGNTEFINGDYVDASYLKSIIKKTMEQIDVYLRAIRD